MTPAPRARPPRLKLITATLGVGGLIAIGVMLASDHGSAWFAVAVGVLGSLIASFYALWVNVLILGERGDEADRIEEALAAIKRGAPLLEHGGQHGVMAIMPKSAFRREDWIALLDGAETELYIVGHALYKWCRDDVKQPFVAAIRRVVLNGGRVQLIVLDPDSTITRRIGELRGKEYPRRVRETLTDLAQIRLQLPDERQPRLDVRMLTDDTPMPYVLAGNEHELITAPYPVAADSDTMPAIRMHVASPLGSAIRDDLRRLVGTYSASVDLRDY